jgi:hypothetical protein
MGYTHYWSINAPPKGGALKAERAYQRSVKKCQRLIRQYSKEHGGLSGYTAHCNPGQYGGIKLNGSERTGQCEDFIFREHFNENQSDFCKTNRYQYDTVVTACLIILSKNLKGLLNVSSDGDSIDWINGLLLVQKIYPNENWAIPLTIRRKLKVV